MKRMVKVLVVIAVAMVVVIGAFGSFAANNAVGDNGSWAFCIYLVDNENTIEYNSNIVKEMGSINFPSNVKIVSDSSFTRSLPGFLQDCKKRINADHKVLIIVGDGEGVYGIKKGERDHLSLGEIRDAFTANYDADVNNPPFELTYIDASLMGCVEMGKILNGYSKYLLASETFSYKGSGFYRNWFSSFCNSKGATAETLGSIIVDSYKAMIDTEYIRNKRIISTDLALMSVDKLNKAYAQYLVLVKSMVKRIAKDNLMLSHISRAARMTVSAGDTKDKTFDYNMVDCLDFMEKIKGYFPVECSKVRRNLEEAMIKKVNLGFVLNTFGVSIYFPKFSFDRHNEYMTRYLMDVSKNEYVNGLYIYKMSGKVTDDFKQVLKRDGIGRIVEPDCDPEIFKDIIPATNNSLTFTYKLPSALKSMLQYCYINVYKRDGADFICYNEDSYFKFDKNNNIQVLYEGKWDCINDVPLFFNPLSETKDYKKFYTKVLYNDQPRLLYCVYQHALGGSKIVGNIDTTQNTKLVGNIVNEMNNGDAVSIYKAIADPAIGINREQVATTFNYNSNYLIKNEMLEDGEYTCYIILEDTKGERHKGENILFNIKNGKIHEVTTETELLKKFNN